MTDTSVDGSRLRCDFSWKSWKTTVTNAATEETFAIVHYHYGLWKVNFHTGDDQTRFGKGNIPCVSINADCEHRGREMKVKALKRWSTQYTHLSAAYSEDAKTPMEMRWTSQSSFKDWDFICLNEREEAVAKFTCKIWGLRKIAEIEFAGDKANDRAAQEEILIAGLTLMYTMAMRVNSPLSLFGSIFARPGPLKEADKEQSEAHMRMSAERQAVDTAGHGNKGDEPQLV